MEVKKFLRIAGIVAAVVVLLLVALAVTVKLVITPEGVRKTVLPLVEKHLHRTVTIGGIDIGIFSGITLNDVTIREKEGQGEFVRAKQLKLRYQFWPLLSKRIIVDELGLDTPSVRVVRLPDGTFNYSDITAKKEPAPEEKAEKGKVNLLVSKVSLTNGTLLYEDRKADPPFTYTISGMQLESTGIALDKPIPFSAKAAIPGAAVSAEGKADVTKKPAVVDVVVRLTESNLQKLVAGLPPQYAAKAKVYAPTGGITGRIHVAGETSAPKQLLRDGEMRLDKVELTASGQRASLTGDIVLKGDTVSSSNLRLSAGPNTAQISFSAGNLTGKPLSISSSIAADRFDLDPFLKKEEKSPAAPAADKPEPGPLNLPVKASGTVQIGQTSYKGLPITQLALKYRLADNILVVDQLSGNVAGGSFSDSARVDLTRKGFDYSSRLKVQGVQANPVVAAFAPRAAGTVSGALSLNAEVSGRGTRSEAIKKNASGRGDFAITDGKLTGAGLVQGLAQFLNVEQLRVVQFSKFAGNFRMDAGKVVVDSSVSGRDLQITPKGTAGLDKSLDLSLVTRLSPPLTSSIARGNVGKFMTDSQGWGTLPLKVTGTFSSPTFRLDTSQLGGQLKSKAQEQLQQTIQEKLFRKKEGEPKRPEQDILERGLKGILGR